MDILLRIGEALAHALEPAGIIAGLVFSGISLRDSSRSRRLENQIRLADGYRDIWTELLRDEKLSRIREPSVDLGKAPVTPAEDRLVRFIFQQVFLAFEARRTGQLGDIGDLEKDVEDFLSRPIPRAVWREVARFQPEAFRKFIEKLI
ncbi:MAG: hypothetical protein V4726_22220 [Verrucomicrobiota bacterium]